MAERSWLRFYEKGVPSTIHYPDVPLPSFLKNSTTRFSNNPAIIYYGRRISYEELDKLSDSFACALLSLGVKKGDRVSLMLPNLPQMVIGFYGALKAGAIIVQTNPLYVERELLLQLQDSGAETIVTLDIFYKKVKSIADKTSLKNIIVTGIQDFLPGVLKFLYLLKTLLKGEGIGLERDTGFYNFQELISGHQGKIPQVEELFPEDTALLQYTGGTTGVPKGVMLSHKNLVSNTLQCRYWMTDLMEGKEVFLSVIPFFHVYGMTTCMNLSVLLASTMVLLPKFHVKKVLKAIKKYRPSIFPGIQAMYVAVNNYPRVHGYNISSIRVCISGAGPLMAEVQEKFEGLTGGKLVEGYGLSEASPVTHCNPIYGRRKKGSIGLPFPDTDAKVVDLDTGERELQPGEVGELIIRGPQIMKGYWNRPEETKATLRDGWLYTGDMAKRDEEGYFYIADRKKDMIKTLGENVYPREIEEVLYRHPKVKEAVVAGIPDEYKGEMIKAYVVLKEGEMATEAEIIEFCKKDLSKFKIPKVVEFRKELPKTIVGKVLRRMLVEEEAKRKKE